ncbi:CsgG/HfaB family protein [Gallaecimonas pentaromativorans]|uniref:Curli production assembly/transport component CsgG n=1 Tax=Gallaecimonas pentaromativorans TaxID=584787 RepID=A0A3N1NWF1_9GAMM|nr:CsgG/HfaB family protein [Gallaecimonas pentaromativorans]MED5524899.1 CsgG/HfaB family protein [Pseudomonadota bacterium]ROQ24154.1 curli production assembly/transport component CsgG [Gallaecimonas pentaromativorans]
MRLVLSLAASLLLGGCAAFNNPQFNLSDAQVNPPSQDMLALEKGPKPRHPIPVAVYAFRDQTGQYKPQENVSSFSTAVTQGGTSILVQLLLDSGWFMPMEREGLQNLLTERKIVSAAQQKGQELPSLQESRLIFEGGIISYETNLNTGGIGLEYYGIGASELYREDQVSVYLRAVDVRSGRVLLSVSASKKVLSQEMRAGLFRYVSLNRLAEAEAGFTTNEPVQLCVRQAMEAALIGLIQQGEDKGYWRADDTGA